MRLVGVQIPSPTPGEHGACPLDRHGEFYPFAVSPDADGEIAMVAASPDGSEHPASTDVLDLLYEGLVARATSLHGAAVVADVTRRAVSTDAIRVEIEHREGVGLAVFLPYSRKRLGRGVRYGDLEVEPGERRIWPG